MNYKDGKWAKQLLALQNPDGTWGSTFHTLTAIDRSNKLPTTEQALRRLKALGFTLEDAPIRKTVDTMLSCLRGERKIDDYWEKGHDWDLFTRMMLSTWVRVFDPDNETALQLARKWAAVLEHAFAGGSYDHGAYLEAYHETLSKKVSGLKVIGFMNFYIVSLMQGVLTHETEDRLLEHILKAPEGIYYLCNGPVREPPQVFQSRETVRWLGGIELLSGYKLAPDKLGFAVEWLRAQESWDMGKIAKNHIYLPLRDSWRKAEDRKEDCTEWINRILANIL